MKPTTFCALQLENDICVEFLCVQAVPQPTCAVPGVQAAQVLMQEAGWVLREAVEVSSGPLRKYRKTLQVYNWNAVIFMFSFTIWLNYLFALVVYPSLFRPMLRALSRRYQR